VIRSVFWFAPALLWLCACVTTDADGTVRPKKKADLVEAARLNTELGVDYMRRGEFDLALEKLQRALDQNPEYAPAHASIAIVYAQRGEAAQAERHYRRAMSLNPDDPAVRNNFGVFLCGQKKYGEAEELLLEAAADKRYRDRENAWLNAGVCARRMPNLEKAERYLREALKLRAELPEALAQLAWIALQNKEYLSSRAFLERYQQVGAPTAETLWIGVQAELALGDKRAARRYAEKLRKDFPDSDESRQSSKLMPT
jgi:type IV pilus assembly protein PilF